MRVIRCFVFGAVLGTLQACSLVGAAPESTMHPAGLEPLTNLSAILGSLPPPKGVITVAVYGFRDQTGQYKQAPDSSFSTAVSQGGSAMLVKALRDSKWFQPVEREGLQDLLTERKILRAVDEKGPESKSPQPANAVPNLTAARLLMEGTIVGYDSNVTTGGLGIKFLGYSLAGQYRKDQVTVNLRASDISNGTILHTVTTTKTVYSKQIQPGVYRYVSYKDLLEVESGYTYNEPVQLAVQEAIETAVVNMIVEGIYAHSWVLANPEDIHQPLIARLHDELTSHAIGAPTPDSPGPLAMIGRESSVPDLQSSAETPAFASDAQFGPAVRDIPLRPSAEIAADKAAAAELARQEQSRQIQPRPLPPKPTPEQARALAVQKQRKIDSNRGQNPTPSPPSVAPHPQPASP